MEGGAGVEGHTSEVLHKSRSRAFLQLEVLCDRINFVVAQLHKTLYVIDCVSYRAHHLEVEL